MFSFAHQKKYGCEFEFFSILASITYDKYKQGIDSRESAISIQKIMIEEFMLTCAVDGL